MQSIKTIYKIGPGPSSSHTFGPMMASKYINEALSRCLRTSKSPYLVP